MRLCYTIWWEMSGRSAQEMESRFVAIGDEDGNGDIIIRKTYVGTRPGLDEDPWKLSVFGDSAYLLVPEVIEFFRGLPRHASLGEMKEALSKTGWKNNTPV